MKMKFKILFIIMSSIITIGCDPSSDQRVACIYAIDACKKFEDSTERQKCLGKAFETVCNLNKDEKQAGVAQ